MEPHILLLWVVCLLGILSCFVLVFWAGAKAWKSLMGLLVDVAARRVEWAKKRRERLEIERENVQIENEIHTKKSEKENEKRNTEKRFTEIQLERDQAIEKVASLEVIRSGIEAEIRNGFEAFFLRYGEELSSKKTTLDAEKAQEILNRLDALSNEMKAHVMQEKEKGQSNGIEDHLQRFFEVAEEMSSVANTIQNQHSIMMADLSADREAALGHRQELTRNFVSLARQMDLKLSEKVN